MKALLTACAGMLLIGAVGASDLNAQRVSVQINKGNKQVEVNAGRGAEVRITREQPKPSGHYVTVKEKVWHPGHYKTVTERVWVPEEHKIVIERVYVPAETITVRERRVDHCGNVYFVNVCKTIPAHYKNVEKCVVIPGHFCEVRKQVWVEGHYDIIEKQVWVEHDKPGNGHGHGHGHVSHKR